MGGCPAPASAAAASVAGELPLNIRWPRTMASTASTATPAMSQGNELPRAVRPTAVPQAWQNLAPGMSSVSQPAQRASPSGAPQDEQNRPAAGSPQLGQVADDVMVEARVRGRDEREGSNDARRR